MPFCHCQWLEKIVIGWIRLIYASCSQAHSPQRKFAQHLAGYKRQLAHFMYTHYAHTRISRLFDIVVDFPESARALADLAACLAKTDLRAHVVASLRAAIEQRLLHPGVNTSDILTAYVSAIKVATRKRGPLVGQS